MNISKIKVLFLFGNLLPFFQLLFLILLLIKVSGIGNLIVFTTLYIYILPPVLFRMIHFFIKIEPGAYKISDHQLLVWWYGAQLQLAFSRFPFFEELLRTIPFLYSAWLRLWGAKIGSLVYWSPRIEILDRNLIEIGDRVVVGYGVKMTSHLINKEKFFIAPISIGRDCVIGGESRIAPGCSIAPDMTLAAMTILPPMTSLNSTEEDKQKKNR